IWLGIRRIGGEAASFSGAGDGEAVRRRPAGAASRRDQVSRDGHFPYLRSPPHSGVQDEAGGRVSIRLSRRLRWPAVGV
uniref:Uncharacterized protein n=1 Tax=Oryza punctata TaxID=4537 RepID=A0A0E0JEQ7_ORYPU